MAVTPAALAVDGLRMTEPGELAKTLKNKRELWRQLNPGRTFPGVVTFQIDRTVSAGVVKRALREVARAGYPRFAFQVRRIGALAKQRASAQD